MEKHGNGYAKDEPVQNPHALEETPNFLIVGIGASAGGIKALKEFFGNVRPDSGMAYVVILHLSPEFESKLAEILQTVSAIPVTQIRDEQVKVTPDNVYVIPPNRSLAMVDGHLALSQIESYEERRAPVDIFFRTLADSNDGRAVSIILSGTGSDGSMGMKRVKERGGIVLVQDPKEAEYDDMPRNSIAQGLVDFILPVGQMPAQLIHYRDQLKTIHIAVKPDEPSKEEADEKALREIFTQLRIRTSHDFSNYKRATILRRIERRMNVRVLDDLTAYAHFIREQPDEAQILLKDLLISVTNFFRDREPFEALERNIIPRLFYGKTAQDHVRIWIAGCATGEEAYSLAMICCEYAADKPDMPSIQIFATDIDQHALNTARDGYYSNADVADVSPERLRRFFTREGSGFRIRRELREMILFAYHNLIKDPPFSHLDLVTCRNLLIYLNRNAQSRVMDTFHFALKPGAHLFLGSSESIDGSGDLYTAIDREHCIFQSRAVLTRPLPYVEQMKPAVRFTDAGSNAAYHPPTEVRIAERLSVAGLHQHLLELYAPPSILINSEYNIIHLSESAGRYLQLMGGEPSLNLLKVVLPELRLELRGALYTAAQKGISIRITGLQIRTGQLEEVLNIIVRPVNGELEAARGFLMVLFEPASADTPQSVAAITDHTEPVAHQLEEELMRTRSQLRSTAEQYEVQAEEFKASNEELQAINEELRSAAEELETSKEELQSVNEELTTVNQELKIKIDELSQTSNDFQNLINSTDIATVFLDRAFGVKFFTPSAREIFNLIPADYGRPLSDITHRLSGTDITFIAENVMETLQPVEREVQTTDGRTFLMRILVYRTAEDRINGVVVTFVNITPRKQVEEALRASEERLSVMINQAMAGVKQIDLSGKVLFANQRLLHITGYTQAELAAMGMLGVIHPDDQEAYQLLFRQMLEDDLPFETEQRIIRKDGSVMWVYMSLTLLRDRTGSAHSALVILLDITRQKALEMQKDEFIGIASHELKTPVTSIKAYTEILHKQLLKNGDDHTVSLSSKLNRQVDRLTTLIRDLLDTTRISEGHLQLIAEPVDLNALIREITELLQPTTHHNLHLELAALPPVMADKERIAQLLINLMGNAIKYSPDADQVIIASKTNGNEVIVCIRDFGIGLSEEVYEKIFERFYRVNDVSVSTFPGLGLGLYIAAEIVKQHGGKIWATAGKGDGSVFCFSLPLIHATHE